MTTLADIEIKILLLSDSLPRCGRFAARKALARIAQHLEQPLSAIAASDAETLYEKLRDNVAPKSWTEEQRYLVNALSLPELPQGLADRVRRGAATLADACAAVELQVSWGGERSRIANSIQRFASLVQRRTGNADTFAIERIVDPLLAEITHTDLGLSVSSLPAFRSRVRRAVRLVDIHARQQVSASLLGTDWQALIELAREQPQQRGTVAKLWPLIAFCHRQDILPYTVDDAVITSLLADLERRACRDPLSIARGVVYAWERLQANVAGWPSQKLERLYQRGSRIHAVGFSQLPESFKESWGRFVAEHSKTSDVSGCSLARFVPDDETEFSIPIDAAPVLESGFGSQHLLNLKTWITYAANVVIARGEEISDLRSVVRPDVVHAVLELIGRQQRARANAEHQTFHRSNLTLLNAATSFITLARLFDAGNAEIDRLIGFRDRVDPRLQVVKRERNGEIKRIYHDIQIGPRHAERLAQFRDPAKLKAWFDVPDHLWERMQTVARRRTPPTSEEINDAIVCVLHHVTMGGCPARRANIASLKIYGAGRNLELPLRKGQPGHITVNWWQVKNRREISIALTPHAAEVIGHFIEHFRPQLISNVGASPDNQFLFPAVGQAHRSGVILNRIFLDRNRRIGGFILNMHVQRHLAAFVILKQDPNAMDIVQKILGHRNRKTTERYYAQVDEAVVQQRYHELLDLARDRAQRLPLMRGKR